MSLLDLARSRDDDEKARDLESRTNVASAVLAARVARRMTQEELGRAAGSKQSRISEIESLDANPRLDTLDKIAAALDLAVSLVPRCERKQDDIQLQGFQIKATVVAYFASTSFSSEALPSSVVGHLKLVNS